MRESLECKIHDGAAVLRFELAGRLSGRGAESVNHAWNTALSVIGDRPLIIDITSVDQADDRGCAGRPARNNGDASRGSRRA